MSLKVDLKLVAVTCIFLGLFMGFYVDRTLISKPKIETLTSQVDTQLVTIEGLEQDFSTIQVEYDVLDDLYTEQSENIVPLNIHEALQEEADTMEEELTLLEAQVVSLNLSVDIVEDQLEELQEDYEVLVSDHDRLQDRFDEIYTPGYVAFSYDGLEINLTVAQLQFQTNIPIEGTVTVRYSNGNSYEGTFKLRITSIVTKAGSVSGYYEVHGESDYSWSGAFIGGAGSYKLAISELLDSQGVEVAPGTELRSHFITIFMG
jgi:hypothetical protein